MNSEHPVNPEESTQSNNSDPDLSRCKGVLPQPNGQWGAQIYAQHMRIWLGTFKTKKEAAMAYDSAAMMLKSGDLCRNLASSPQTALLEAQFQSQFDKEDVISMIRDGSYQPSFAKFKDSNSV